MDEIQLKKPVIKFETRYVIQNSTQAMSIL